MYSLKEGKEIGDLQVSAHTSERPQQTKLGRPRTERDNILFYLNNKKERRLSGLIRGTGKTSKWVPPSEGMV